MELGSGTRNLLIGAAVLLLAAGLGGFLRFKRFVDEDPRLCATCHRASPEFGLWLAGSHRSHDPKWPQVGGSRGHKVHYEQQKIACVKCHAAGVHGFEPVSAACRFRLTRSPLMRTKPASSNCCPVRSKSA